MTHGGDRYILTLREKDGTEIPIEVDSGLVYNTESANPITFTNRAFQRLFGYPTGVDIPASLRSHAQKIEALAEIIPKELDLHTKQEVIQLVISTQQLVALTIQRLHASSRLGWLGLLVGILSLLYTILEKTQILSRILRF